MRLRQVLFVVQAGNSNLAKTRGPKLVVHKVAMQCTNIKFTSAAYHACEMVNNGVPMKVISVYALSAFSVCSEVHRNSAEIGLCA